MLKKLSIFFLGMVVFFFTAKVEAQTYGTGIGLRAGVSNGLTVKHFISNDAAIEGILHTRWRGLVITGLYEVHKDISEVRGLRWFYGGGAHIGTWNSSNVPPWHSNYNTHNRATTVVGIDGIIGLDYKFIDAPVNLSLDYKPAFNFNRYSGWWGDELALSIRFTF